MYLETKGLLGGGRAGGTLTGAKASSFVGSRITLITSDQTSAMPVRERGQVVADTVFYPLPLGEVSSRSPEPVLTTWPRADGCTRRVPTWFSGRVEDSGFVLAIVSCSSQDNRSAGVCRDVQGLAVDWEHRLPAA